MFVALGSNLINPTLVMIRKQNDKTQLVIIDHGLYQKISDKDRLNLSFMWKAIVLGNRDEMRKYSTLLGVDGDISLD